MGDFIQINNPGYTIPGLPGLLRYTPVNSVVVIPLGSPDTDARRVWAMELSSRLVQVGPLMNAIRATRATRALVVVVADSLYMGKGLTLAEMVRDELTEASVTVAGAWRAHQIADKELWQDLTSDAQGVMDDPATHPLTVEAIAHGFTPHLTAEDIERRYQRVTEEAPRKFAQDAFSREEDDFAPNTLRRLVEAVRANAFPGPELASRVGFMVTYPGSGGARFGVDEITARDALAMLGAVDAHVALRLFTDIATQLRGVARARVLTLAGVFAYWGDSGVDVRAALMAAVHSTLAHGEQSDALLRALMTGLMNGEPAEFVSGVISAGVEICADVFGVSVEPLVEDDGAQ
ncbi:DUF4192 family protein [Nocardia takedensis]|uniref:DUF4192 family protein n=1 Tax=Nocardia takedensis TaxID=259390 RepID=UPI003F769267